MICFDPPFIINSSLLKHSNHFVHSMLQQKNGAQRLEEINGETIPICEDFTALIIPINWYQE